MGGELSFGEWLKRRRRSLGLTQEDLARQVGCSTIALRKIEAEERRPSEQVAQLLAHCLRIEPERQGEFVRLARGEITLAARLPSPVDVDPVASAAIRRGLPRYLTTLVGREAIEAQLLELILRPEVRLLTLVGPPGIGKTRLAVQVAQDLEQRGPFEAGVDYVHLADIDDPEQVLPTIAQTIGLEDLRRSGLAERLARALSGRARLFVIDNFEHVVEAAPSMADLLGAVPMLRLLVTSRSPLRVEGEVLFSVPPLEVPGLENPPDPQAVRQFPAVMLFEERARRARRDFAVTAGTASTVTAICARLDGLPLAIELVAARVNSLPPQELLARLGGTFVLHLEGMRGRPPRHQSMSHAVQWSYDLLTPREQAVFRRLGVFLGGFGVEAAEAVCADLFPSAEPAAPGGQDALALTTALVEKGLVLPGEGPSGETRFGMLAVVREFAIERLREAGESDMARRNHASHFRRLVERGEPMLDGPRQIEWLDCLARELPNLRTALRWSLAEDVEAGLAIAAALWKFWLIRGDVSEGRDWLERLIHASKPSSGGPNRWRVKAGYVAAHLATTQGDSARARSLALESLAAAGETSDAELLGFALAVAGTVAYRADDFEGGERRLSESLEVFRIQGNDSGAAFALYSLYALEFTRDHLERAAFLRQECLDLNRRLADPWGIMQALGQAGNAARIDLDFAKALRMLDEQLGIAKSLGSKPAISFALNGIARVLQDQGDLARAVEAYEEALALSRETGDQARLAWGLQGMGVIAWRQGDLSRARSLLQECLACRRGIGSAPGIILALQGLGDVSRSEADWGAAREAFHEALEIADRAGLVSDAAHTLERLGLLADARGDREMAAKLLGAASRWRDEVNCILPPLERADDEQAVASVRSKLQPAVFVRDWAEGRAMSLKDAIELGLSV
jgi:predicted ATPase/DNA-binding XRE family transcriptional regulator